MYIPVEERKVTGKTTGYTPVAKRTTLPPVDYKGTLGEIKSPYSFTAKTSTQAIPDATTPNITPNRVVDLAKTIGQFTARSIASAGITVASKIDPRVKPLKPDDFQSFFTQALVENVFGKDPNKSIEQRIVEAEPKVKQWGQELKKLADTPTLNTREKLVVKTLSYLAENHPTTLAFTGIMGEVGLDLSGYGGLEKNVYKAMIKAGTDFDAIRVLTKMGVADDLARQFAPDVVKVSDEKSAKALFSSIAKLQETTHPSTYIPLASRVPPKSAPTAPITGETSNVAPTKLKGRDSADRVKEALKIPTDQLASKADYVKPSDSFKGAKVYGFYVDGYKEPLQITVGADGKKISHGYDYSSYNKLAPITPKVDIVDPLTTEAQKYGSAEEFVKAQTPIFRGQESAPSGNRLRAGATSEYTGVAYSRQLEQAQKYGDLELHHYMPESKILKPEDISPSTLKQLRTEFSKLSADDADTIPTEKIITKVMNLAKQNNKAAADIAKFFPEMAEEAEIRVLNSSAVKTKSQLTDFYNKVSKPKELPIPAGLPKIRKPKVVNEKLENLRTQVEIGRETVADMPGRQLAKFVSRETGELPELSGRGGKFSKQGDTLFQDVVGQEASKGGDVDVAQKMVDEYKSAKANLTRLEAEYKQAKKDFRSKKILDELSTKVEKAHEKLRAFEKENPKLFKATLPLSEEATKGAKIGYKVGVAETRNNILTKLRVTTEATQEIKTSIVDFVKKNLDTADRGKALVLVRDAKTQKDITKAFARINRWAEEAEKKVIKTDILKLQKQIMDSPSIAIDYKSRVKELMGDFELKGHREDTLVRLKKTQEFLQSEAAKGNDIEMPRRILRSLELLNRTPFDEITTSQLTGLKAEMELLEQLGQTKFRTTESIWEIQKSKILDEVATQGEKPITNIELIKPAIGERLTITQKFKNLVWSMGNQAARIDKAIAPMDTIFDLLDGGKATYAGANFRFFKGQVDAGYGKYITRKDALQHPVVEMATKHGLEDTNFERMGIVAARDQDGGVEKLLASDFTQAQIDAVKLSKEEQEVLDLMRSTMDSQFPEIQDTMRRVYNQPVEKVKNYFSFMTDWKAMDESEVFQRFGSQAPEQFGMPRKNVEAGFVQSRVGGDQKIKVNALDVFLQHTDNTSYLLELGETTKMLGEVAASPRYAELVGDVGQLMVREWLDVIARKGGAAGASNIAVLDTLRRNVGAGILGLKLSTIAIQPTALIDGMGFIGAKYGMKGVTNFTTDSAWRKFIAEMPEIKDRLGGEFALRELTDDNWLQNIQRKGFIPLQKLDQLTAGAVATGAYERKMVELGLEIDLTKPFNKEALEYAQLAVRRTQSSGSFKDVPLAVSRGALTGNRSLDRAILQFQNFLLTRWSRIRHDAFRAGIRTKDPTKAIPIFMAIIFASLAASGTRLGVNKIQDFISGREDEDTATEDLTKGFMYEMTGNVPFLGTTISMALYDGEMFPILDAPKGVISGLNRVITSKSEGAKLRGFTEFAGSTGALLGIPGSTQAESLVRGALQDEKAEPKTKKLKTPAGLPELPSLKKSLPAPPGLPKLP